MRLRLRIDKSQVKRILFITLSNVGDIILTTPILKTLVKNFPGARIDVMVSPAGKEIFEKDPSIFKLIIYDKHMPFARKRRLQLKLKNLRYDLVVDIRNTIFPLLLGPRYRTPTIQRFPKGMAHKKARHLYTLASLGIDDFDESSYIHMTKEDEEAISSLLKEEGIKRPFVIISPGAKSHLKRWTEAGYAAVADRLAGECGMDVVFIGLGEDREIVSRIIKLMTKDAHDLVNRTNIRELAGLLKRSNLVITNDSAPLHLACAVGAKVLAIFGPTDPRKYGPTGEFDVVVNKKLSCSPCEAAVCKYDYECMKTISPDEVFYTARMMVEGYE